MKRKAPKSTTTSSATSAVPQSTLPPARLKHIELFGYDYFDIGWPAEAPPNGDDSAIEQLYFHLHHTMSVVNELNERVGKLETVSTPSTTAAVVQIPTTTEAPPSTTDLQALCEANAKLAEENVQLQARNAALEAEVSIWKKQSDHWVLQVGEREDRLARREKDYDHLQSVNSRNAERTYEAEAKAEELEGENAGLRIALHKLAEAQACALKALLPA